MSMPSKAEWILDRMTWDKVRRFWSHVDGSGGVNSCWPWTAGLCSHGYGSFRISRVGGATRAHRIAMVLSRGRSAGDLHALHQCDNPVCCNPRHLRPGTHAENMRESKDRGRSVSGTARLTHDQVREIRALCKGDLSQRVIGLRYGVGKGCVSFIHQGKRWGSVK